MTPDLKTLIDGHHAAMLAQAADPKVPLEYRLDNGEWVHHSVPLLNEHGPMDRRWHRLAPPKPVRRKAWVCRPREGDTPSSLHVQFHEPTDKNPNWLPIEWDEPPPEPPTPAPLSPGEGWTLLEEGTPLQKGDGFMHPGYSGQWIDFECRPDLFRGNASKQCAHTWPWRRKAEPHFVTLQPVSGHV